MQTLVRWKISTGISMRSHVRENLAMCKPRGLFGGPFGLPIALLRDAPRSLAEALFFLDIRMSKSEECR